MWTKAYLAYGVPKSDLKLFSLMQKVISLDRRLCFVLLISLLPYLIPFVLDPQAAYTVGGHSYTAATMEYVILKMKPPMHRPQIVWALNPASSVRLFFSPLSESVKQFALFADAGFASCHPQDESIRRTAQGKHWYTWTSSRLCSKLWNVLFTCGNLTK